MLILKSANYFKNHLTLWKTTQRASSLVIDSSYNGYRLHA